MTPAARDQLAADLRLVIGRLVRSARGTDPLSAAQAAVLGHLDRERPATTSDLAAVVGVRPQSMAATVASLVEARLIRGVPHPTDGRKTLLGLTKAGSMVLEQRRQRLVDWLAEGIAQLTPDEQRTLAAAVPLLARLERPR